MSPELSEGRAFPVTCAIVDESPAVSAPTIEPPANDSAIVPAILELTSTPRKKGPVIAAWSLDAVSQQHVATEAAVRGLQVFLCEHPAEMAGCGLAILLLDHLHPWGNADEIYSAAASVPDLAPHAIFGVSYDDEHPLRHALMLFPSIQNALDAI